MDHQSQDQIGRLLSRYPILLVIGIGLLVAAAMGMWVGSGEIMKAGGVIAGCIAVGTTLALGRNYWMLIPFAFTSDLPAIPVGGRTIELGELAGVAGGLTFLARYAMKLQRFTLFHKSHAPVLLYAGWAMFIFFLHPVGLSSSGESLGGARFYAKILLGLVAFIVMANQEIGERECKWIIIITVVATVLTTAYEIGSHFLPFLRESGPVEYTYTGDAFYTWQQALGNVPTLLVLLMLARYRSGEIFSLQRGVWLLGLFVGSVAMIVASGKRGAVGMLPLFTITAAFFRKEYGYFMLWITGAFLAVVVLVAGHGTLFHLPLTAQRALSFLPAKWDTEMEHIEGGQDSFRKELRRLAWIKIKQDPWVGTGYQVDLKMAQDMAVQYAIGGGDIEAQVAPMAMSSVWHNTWLGYAADFGIPASILVGFIYLTVLRRAWTTARVLPPHSMTMTLTMYILLFSIRDAAFSHTSGHSALDAFSRWWIYGLLIAIELTNRQRLATPPAEPESAGGRPLLQPAIAGRPARQPARVQRPAAF